MDSEDVVVRREHVKSGLVGISSLNRNGDLRVVDSGEVTGTRWLMLFWLERKRVRVDPWHWGGGVVDEWLDVVKVLTALFLESVLTVEDQLEGVNGPEVSSSNCARPYKAGAPAAPGAIATLESPSAAIGRHRNRGVSKVPQRLASP